MRCVSPWVDDAFQAADLRRERVLPKDWLKGRNCVHFSMCVPRANRMACFDEQAIRLGAYGLTEISCWRHPIVACRTLS